MLDDAGRLGDDERLPTTTPCAFRLARVGPLSSSAKQQDKITRAVVQVNSSMNHDGGFSARSYNHHAQIRSPARKGL